MLVADLDFIGINDFVMAHIVYSGPKDPKRVRRVEQNLHALAREWNVDKAPEQFLANELSACTLDKPCVPEGGAGWLGYGEAKTEPCGEEISFTVQGKASEGNGTSLDLDAADLKSECSNVEFKWSFGDGKSAITTKPTVTHEYDAGGKLYAVSATARCRRQFTVCEGPTASARFPLKP